MKNKKAFTLIELIISVTITSIVIIPLMVFISDTSAEINYSNIKTKNITNIYKIEDKINEIKSKYLSGSILIDNNTNSGADIIIFKTTPLETKQEGYVFALINFKTLKIDSNNNIGNIGEKYFAYRKISETELNDLNDNPEKIYDYKFHLDKIFKGLILKNFQVIGYNNNSILEFNFLVYNNFKKNSLITKYDEVEKKFIEKYILNF